LVLFLAVCCLDEHYALGILYFWKGHKTCTCSVYQSVSYQLMEVIYQLSMVHDTILPSLQVAAALAHLAACERPQEVPPEVGGELLVLPHMQSSPLQIAATGLLVSVRW
jgi:hypothetical protein